MFRQTQYATVGDGLRLAYADSGQNSTPAILLVHGIFDHKGTWRSLVEHMPDVRCVAPDLLGHGQSDRPSLFDLPPEQRYSPDMQAAYLSHFVERLGLESIVLGGSSLGGGIALRLFLDYPDIRRRTRARALCRCRLPTAFTRIYSRNGRLVGLAAKASANALPV